MRKLNDLAVARWFDLVWGQAVNISSKSQRNSDPPLELSSVGETSNGLYEQFNNKSLPTFMAGGLIATALTRAEWVKLFFEIIRAGRRNENTPFFSSINGETISRCARSADIRSLFEQSDGLAIDSMPVVFASRLFSKKPVSERAATTDLFHDVAQMAEQENISFYLLGGSREVNKKTVQKLNDRYPRLRIVGSRDGYFDWSDGKYIAEEINRAAPDILWVSMGVPREQNFCVSFGHYLPDVGLIKTSGGLFDFISEHRSRAPIWMQDIGLEWLYRLSLEPRRLFKRYMFTNLDAFWLLLTQTHDLDVDFHRSRIFIYFQYVLGFFMRMSNESHRNRRKQM